MYCLLTIYHVVNLHIQTSQSLKTFIFELLTAELRHEHLALEDLLDGGPDLGVGHLLGGVLDLDQAGHGAAPDVQVLARQPGAAALQQRHRGQQRVHTLQHSLQQRPAR